MQLCYAASTDNLRGIGTISISEKPGNLELCDLKLGTFLIGPLAAEFLQLLSFRSVSELSWFYPPVWHETPAPRHCQLNNVRMCMFIRACIGQSYNGMLPQAAEKQLFDRPDARGSNGRDREPEFMRGRI
jgi:hypothetical protein